MLFKTKQHSRYRFLLRIKQLLTGTIALSLASLASGLGLGDITYHSKLGQPLVANIAIIADGEFYIAEEIKVRRVRSEEAKKLGFEIDYKPYRFEFTPQGKGTKLNVLVRSVEKINEPFLNIVVELQWPGGVVYREYTLLLDPP